MPPFSQLIRSPFVRIPFLLFAVLSSVATSAPDSWTLEDATPGERIELAPGAKVERRFMYEASEPSNMLTVKLDGLSVPSSGKVDVRVLGCTLNAVFEQREGDQWARVDASGYPLTASPSPSGSCSGKTGSFTVQIENLGVAPLAFTHSVKVQINGSPDDEDGPPAGAFVKVRPAL